MTDEEMVTLVELAVELGMWEEFCCLKEWGFIPRTLFWDGLTEEDHPVKRRAEAFAVFVLAQSAGISLEEGL